MDQSIEKIAAVLSVLTSHPLEQRAQLMTFRPATMVRNRVEELAHVLAGRSGRPAGIALTFEAT
jgi:hypothetical protein